jgi:uncharacterized RDD family membrane protein YckC
MPKLSRSNHWRQKTQLSADDFAAMLLVAAVLFGIAIGICVLLAAIIRAADKLLG